jgi:hypothetical protein
MSFTTVNIYLHDMPGSSEQPISLTISKQKIFEYKDDIGSDPIIVQAQIRKIFI